MRAEKTRKEYTRAHLGGRDRDRYGWEEWAIGKKEQVEKEKKRMMKKAINMG